MDNKHELLPITDSDGNVIGKTERGTAHNGSKILHPVVHLHLFSQEGEIYLQKRPEWKDVQPGKWDTSVGGHIDYGENVTTALAREVKEELGIDIRQCKYELLGKYVFESEIEKELVYVHKAVFEGEVTPDANELDGGRFWTMDEIRANLGNDVFTPNFEHEVTKYFL